jgi:hypothetical protein
MFFGHNEGTPIVNNSIFMSHKSDGMLKGGDGILEIPCEQISKTIPYFEELKTDDGRPNEYVYDVVSNLSQEALKMELRHEAIEGLENVPDGILNVKESNARKFDVKLQINDYKYYQYHRNNGVTKIGIVRETENKVKGSNTGNTTHILTPT